MTAVCMAALPASSAFAGNIFATGHDLDLHCSFGAQCGYVKTAVNFVRAGAPDPTKPVLILDNHALEFPTALTNAYAPGSPPPSIVMDPSSAAFATTPLTTSLYSAILIASDASCGGCDLNQVGTSDSDAINARTADIALFFNAGGGLLYGAGAGHGSGGPGSIYYKSAPLPLGGLPVSPPFTLTPAGVAFGLTSTDANCCATHNSFTSPPPGSALTVAERDAAGAVETLFASGTIVGGNIFKLTLTPASASHPVSTPDTTTAALSDKSGPVPGKAVLFTVTGVNPTTGTGTTNASGQTTFTYTGATPGTDTIKACGDLNGNGTCDAGEPTATATVTWTGAGVGADLSLTKSAAPVAPPGCTPAEGSQPCVLHGQNVRYTLTESNAGPSTAVAPKITDTLPAGQSFVSSDAGCTAAAGSPVVVTCPTPDLPSGKMLTIHIVASTLGVPAPLNAPVLQTDTAKVSSTTTDPNPANNSASATITVVPAADLSLTKSSSPNPVIAGQQLTYTLTATNHGPDTATNAVITDTLPPGETLETEGVVELVRNTIGGDISIDSNVAAVAAPGSGQATCTSSVSGGVTTVTCPLGNIASGASKTVTILVVPSTGSAVNNASVSSATADPNLANNHASNTTTVSSNCTVSKTGNLGSIIIRAPEFLCLDNASVSGAIIVHAGAALTVTNSSTVSISADSPVFVTVCNSSVNGSIDVQNASGLVRIGDSPFACAPNRISGSVTLSGNHGGDGGPAIVGNRGSGSLDCEFNNPVATDQGVTNAISGAKLHECSGVGF